MLHKVSNHIPWIWPNLHDLPINIKPMFVLCQRDDMQTFTVKAGMVQLPVKDGQYRELREAWAKTVMKKGKDIPMSLAQALFPDHHLDRFIYKRESD
jgi:hypothetical protein